MEQHAALNLTRVTENDPFIGISGVSVDVECLEGDGAVEGDTLIVKLGETDFAFGLRDHSFGKIISNSQITVAVMAHDTYYTAWFNSSVITPEGIEEANNYHDTVGGDDINDPVFSEAEKKLVYFIRSIEFDDVLDAVSGIEYEVEQSKKKAAVHLREGNAQTANRFDERVARLKQLAYLLGKANKDYVAYIYPEVASNPPYFFSKSKEGYHEMCIL